MNSTIIFAHGSEDIKNRDIAGVSLADGEGRSKAITKLGINVEIYLISCFNFYWVKRWRKIWRKIFGFAGNINGKNWKDTVDGRTALADLWNKLINNFLNNQKKEITIVTGPRK